MEEESQTKPFTFKKSPHICILEEPKVFQFKMCFSFFLLLTFWLFVDFFTFDLVWCWNCHPNPGPLNVNNFEPIARYFLFFYFLSSTDHSLTCFGNIFVYLLLNIHDFNIWFSSFPWVLIMNWKFEKINYNYILYSNWCVLLLNITQCNNLLFKSSIFTNERQIVCLDIIEHKWFCVIKYYTFIKWL